MSHVVFDPLSLDYLRDPFPVLRQLRVERPVLWHEQLNAWLVFGYRDVLGVLTDSARFAADRRRVGRELPASTLNVQSLDPPDQSQLKALLRAAAVAVEPVEIRALASTETRRLVAADATGNVDLVTEVIGPVAALTTLAMLGIDSDLGPNFAEMNRAIVAAMSAGLRPELVQAAADARSQLNCMIRDRLATADAGLLSAVRTDPGYQSADHLQLISSLRVVALSAINSTARALTLAVWRLIEQCAQDAFRTLRDPVAGIHELVRFDGPVQSVARACVQDITVGGHQLRRGQEVIAFVASANRDAEQFRSADDLCLDRSPNPHLGFGRGAHYCIGTSTAIETMIGVITGLFRAQRWVLADRHDAVAWGDNPALRTITHLHVTDQLRHQLAAEDV